MNEIDSIKVNLKELLEATLKEYNYSAYIIGSLAYNDYISKISDIDLIVIFEERLNAQIYENIKMLINNLNQTFTDNKFDILFISEDQLEQKNKQPVIYYNDGIISYDDNCGNMTPITWYELKTICIKIIGKDYLYKTTLIDVKMYAYNNINTYWTNYIKKLDELELTGEVVMWCVLGVSRIIYLIKENQLVSKTKAGLYMFNRVDNEYRTIIEKAINIRKGINVKINKKDKIMVSKYMKMVIKEVNHNYNKERL